MRIVDLTHPLSDDMPMLAGMARPSFRDIALMERDGYRMSSTSCSTTAARTSTRRRTWRPTATRSTRSTSRGSSATR